MRGLMEITENTIPDGVILRLEGDIDLNSSPSLRKLLKNYISQKTKIIAVNMKEVLYMDSSGIATFIEAYQHQKKYHGRFVLIDVQQHVQSVFTMTRVDKIFHMVEKEEDIALIQ